MFRNIVALYLVRIENIVVRNTAADIRIAAASANFVGFSFMFFFLPKTLTVS